jgi:hypothetical protein
MSMKGAHLSKEGPPPSILPVTLIHVEEIVSVIASFGTYAQALKFHGHYARK